MKKSLEDKMGLIEKKGILGMKRTRAKIHEPYMRFKGWLKSNSLTYNDIAELLGLSKSSVSDRINGFSDFMLYEISTIVSEYGTSYDIFEG